LLCAEGGTGDNHSEVAFRSKNVYGPYQPYEGNPILTQRHLDPKRKDPITTAGHADLVETPDGKWYAVFLGCRPYEDNHFNIGRETFLAPVRWENEWPIITKGDELVQHSYPLPMPVLDPAPVNPFSSRFTFRYDFSNKELDDRFIYLRTPEEKWHSTVEKRGQISLQLRPETVSEEGNPSFIGLRQQSHKTVATTYLEFVPLADNEKAGLVIFQSENHFYFLCKSLMKGKPVIQLYKSTKNGGMELIDSDELYSVNMKVSLRITSDNDVYRFSYSSENKWKNLVDADARFLSTKTAGGFVGCVFGLYATSMGEESKSKAHYDWVEQESY
ncbi:MAG: beta-xylosidase family glycoside hydrolase, partial [Flavisolibacter sp.]